MKIAFLSTFYPYRGGIAQYNAALYRALEQNHQVRAFNFSLQFPSFLFPGSTQFVGQADHADPVPSQRVLNSINPLTYINTSRQILLFKPDLLLLGYFTPFLAPAHGTVAWLLRRKKIPAVAIVNNVLPHERLPLDKQLIRFFMGQLSGAVVMGQAVQQELKDFAPDLKVLLHPHPVYRHFGKKIPQEQARRQLGIPPGKKVLLFFGLIRPYKGLDVLLKTFQQLSDDYFLLVAGEAYEETEKYRQMLQQAKHPENALMHNRYISDNEVPRYFSAADVAVLPYRTATQSGVTAVASHFELPVIVTDTGNLKETVAPWQTGEVIEKADPALLAQAIDRFFSKENSVDYRKNIQNFNHTFTWEHLATELSRFAASLQNTATGL